MAVGGSRAGLKQEVIRLEWPASQGGTRLRITLHDSLRVLPFPLEGRLAGPWRRELEECWQSTLASQRTPTLGVDLPGVTFLDTAGKVCLAAMSRQGAAFVAADCLTGAVVAGP